MNLTCLRIWHYLAQHGDNTPSPSFDNIAAAVGIRAQSVVYHIRELERGAAVQRCPGRYRSLTVLRQPPTNICPCCGFALDVGTQPALIVGRPDFEIGTCRAADCPLKGVTLHLGGHWKLTPEQVATYAQVTRRFATKRTAFEAVQL
jgi:hypothetical protein